MSEPKPRWVSEALTAREVAALLGVNVNTVKRIPVADLPFTRISTRGDRRYRRRDVAVFRRKMTEGYVAP